MEILFEKKIMAKIELEPSSITTELPTSQLVIAPKLTRSAMSFLLTHNPTLYIKIPEMRIEIMIFLNKSLI